MQALGPGGGAGISMGFMLQRMFLGEAGVGWGTSESPVFAQADDRSESEVSVKRWELRGICRRQFQSGEGMYNGKLIGKMGHSQSMEEHSSLLFSF